MDLGKLNEEIKKFLNEDNSTLQKIKNIMRNVKDRHVSNGYDKRKKLTATQSWLPLGIYYDTNDNIIIGRKLSSEKWYVKEIINTEELQLLMNAVKNIEKAQEVIPILQKLTANKIDRIIYYGIESIDVDMWFENPDKEYELIATLTVVYNRVQEDVDNYFGDYDQGL